MRLVISIFILTMVACTVREKEVNYVCLAMPFDQSGPIHSSDTVGMSVKGTDVTFTGLTGVDAPASLWTAKICVASKFANAKLDRFSNRGCSDTDDDWWNQKSHAGDIYGFFDHLTKVLNILNTGKFACRTVP